MRKYNEELLDELYQYIIDCQRARGVSPSYREIARNLSGFSSTAKIAGYVRVLKDRGLIDTERNGNIAVDDRFRIEAVSVPLVGSIACGQPNFAEEYIEGSYALPAELFGRGKLFMLNACGTSMIDAGIEEGDFLVVRQQNTAYDGEIVVAMVDGETTLKRIYYEDEKIILHPENKTMQDIIVDSCEIQGVLVGCIKMY